MRSYEKNFSLIKYEINSSLMPMAFVPPGNFLLFTEPRTRKPVGNSSQELFAHKVGKINLAPKEFRLFWGKKNMGVGTK
jgi:hypothetical protein